MLRARKVLFISRNLYFSLGCLLLTAILSLVHRFFSLAWNLFTILYRLALRVGVSYRCQYGTLSLSLSHRTFLYTKSNRHSSTENTNFAWRHEIFYRRYLLYLCSWFIRLFIALKWYWRFISYFIDGISVQS